MHRRNATEYQVGVIPDNTILIECLTA